MDYSLKEYKAAYKAAFGEFNRKVVLKMAARDKRLSTEELVELDNWARRLESRRVRGGKAW